MRTLVQVPLGKPFLCPECGRPLHTPPAKPRRSSRRTLLVGTGAAAVALLSLALWRGSDRSSEDHRRIALAAQASLQNAASLQAKAALEAPPLQTLSTTQSAPAPVTQVDALAEALPTLTLAETAAPAAPAPIPSETLAAARYAPSALTVGDEIMAELPTLQLAETLPDRTAAAARPRLQPGRHRRRRARLPHRLHPRSPHRRSLPLLPDRAGRPTHGMRRPRPARRPPLRRGRRQLAQQRRRPFRPHFARRPPRDPARTLDSQLQAAALTRLSC